MEGLDLLKIGEAIKIRRIKRRIHQTKLAEQLGISQTHLSNAENGRVMLSLKALLKLKRISLTAHWMNSLILKITMSWVKRKKKSKDISSYVAASNFKGAASDV